MSEPIRMTTKAKTKTVVCAHPECDQALIVNLFYAPAKARCPDHKGWKPGLHDIPSAAQVGGSAAPINATPTIDRIHHPKVLPELLCPLCGEGPMDLLAAHEKGGSVSFGCRGCDAVVEIVVDWRPLQVTRVPEALRPVAEHLRSTQTHRGHIGFGSKDGE